MGVHNSYIHFTGIDGRTMPEQHDILDRVAAYALINSDTLLPRHWLLFETYFEALGSGPISHRLLWLANMDSALAASSLSQLGSLTSQAETFFPHSLLLETLHSRTSQGKNQTPHKNKDGKK